MSLPGASCTRIAWDKDALLLDFDGTLVDIAATPASVSVPPTLLRDLGALHERLNGALAVVSGRPVGELDALLAPLRLPAAGEHGAAIRTAPAAEPLRPRLPAVPPAWREAADDLARAMPGVLVEQKPGGFVLHYRLAPAAGPALHDALSRLVGGAPGFEIMPAAAAWEVRPRGIDKGEAVRALMQAAPFRGRRPIFIGDDVTDEDGIAAACALGGAGLRVPDAFGDAAGVRAWLAALAREAAAR